MAGAEFFPVGAFDERQEFDRNASSKYQELLEAFGETSLYTQTANTARESFRFTWCRWAHAPVVFRIEILSDVEAEFSIKVGRKPIAKEADQLVRPEIRPLDSTQINSIRMAFRAAGFFALPSHENDREGNDGATWTVEALVKGRYHLVTRWSPETGPVRSIGVTVIEMAIGGDLVPIY